MFLHLSVSHSVHGGGGVIPACLAGLREGVVSQHALQVSRPTPRGEVEGSGPGGSPGPHQGRSPGPHWRGSPGPHRGGGIPAWTEADPPGRRLLLRAVRILLECILVGLIGLLSLIVITI